MPDKYWTDFAREMQEKEEARRRAIRELRKKEREGGGIVCVECGVTFQARGKRKRCDQCMASADGGDFGD